MKKVISFIIVFAMLMPAFAFADYSVSEWAEEEVLKADENLLIPAEFEDADLTENITRGEFAGIAYKLLEALKGGELNFHGGYFADIEGNPYEFYIRGAYEFGITNGTAQADDGAVVFSPDEFITREQLATMLFRVIKNVNPNAKYSGSCDAFADEEAISGYAYEAVYYMNEKGIVKGVDEEKFAPLDTATKEQAILISKRIYDNMYTQPGTKTEKNVSYEGYIGKSFEEIKAEFGNPEYAFAFDSWHYVYYNFGDVSFAFDGTRKFVPIDGTPVYPDDDLYEEPLYGAKGVLVNVSQVYSIENGKCNLTDLDKLTGLHFVPAVEYPDDYYYAVAYDSENVIQYIIKNEGTTVKADDLIFIQDFSHNVYNPNEELTDMEE